jgi:hypothetical protein
VPDAVPVELVPDADADADADAVLAAELVVAAGVVPVAPAAGVAAVVGCALAAWVSACSKLANKVIPCGLFSPNESRSPPSSLRVPPAGACTAVGLDRLEAEMVLVDITLTL